jgi:hypothetical protein
MVANNANVNVSLDALSGREYQICPVFRYLGGVGNSKGNGGEICEGCDGEGKVTWTRFLILCRRASIKSTQLL